MKTTLELTRLCFAFTYLPTHNYESDVLFSFCPQAVQKAAATIHVFVFTAPLPPPTCMY